MKGMMNESEGFGVVRAARALCEKARVSATHRSVACLRVGRMERAWLFCVIFCDGRLYTV